MKQLIRGIALASFGHTFPLFSRPPAGVVATNSIRTDASWRPYYSFGNPTGNFIGSRAEHRCQSRTGYSIECRFRSRIGCSFRHRIGSLRKSFRKFQRKSSWKF